MMRDDPPWQAATRQADPAADDCIAAIGIDRLGEATRLIAQWTTNAGLHNWTPQGPADPEVVAALRGFLAVGRHLPDWARPDAIARAEDVFMDYGPLSCTLLFCASLPECYVLPNLAEVLHAAGQLEAHTEYRIRRTAAMIFPVMMKGGLTSAEGGGIAQTLKVRLIHASIRHLILRGPPAQAPDRVEPLAPMGPVAGLHQALQAHGWNVARNGPPCNQLELAYTLLTFGYVFLRGMRTLGDALTPQQESDFLHAWNVAGHVMGIRDDFMAHTMDEAGRMFTAMQAAARAGTAQPDDRPGLGEALVAAMARSIRIPIVRNIPVPLTCRLIGAQSARDVGIAGRAGLLSRMLFTLGWWTTRTIDRVVRIALPKFSLARMFTRAVGYHLLTHFLMDQSRPLALPRELLDPLGSTVASWHRDRHAPAWLNRVEDRLTTRGEWRTMR